MLKEDGNGILQIHIVSSGLYLNRFKIIMVDIEIIRTPRLCSIIGLHHCNPQRQAAVDASLMFF